MLRTIRFAAAALAVACLVFAPTAAPISPAAGIGDAAKLRKAVNVQGMRKHEQAFQNIASANGGTRASGTPGFDPLGRVRRRPARRGGLPPAGADVRLPVLPGDSRRRCSSASRRARGRSRAPDEFATMTYSGSGDVTAQLQEVNDNQFPPGPTPSSSNAGCEPADFAGFVPGQRRADPARHVHVPRQGAQRADRRRRPPSSSSTRASPAAPTRSPARSARPTSTSR